MKKKLLVLGLDGADWKILKPFAEKGYLPTIARILKEGVHGALESTIPSMTAPSWTTFVTGKHPGKHGLFDFLLPTDSLAHMKFATSRDIRDKTIYEIVKENGLTPILINLPGSWPPRLADDITITSILTQGDQWIYPASLKKEFPELTKYRLTPNESLRLKENESGYIEDLLLHLDEWMAATKRIFKEKPWDFFFFLFSHTDWVSHLCFDKMLTDNHEGARRVFAKVDESIAWFLENKPTDTNVLFVSDHGFAAYHKIFYFNRWLEKEGYLTTNNQGDAHHGAVTRRAKETDKIRNTKTRLNLGSGLFTALSRFPWLERAAKWSYHHIIKPYLPLDLKVNVGIDFSKTRVCFPKGAYITNAYINKDWVYQNGTVSREQYPKLRAEVVEKMRNIHDPEGQPVVARVFTRDEVYGQDAPEQAPDIFFELNEYWLVGQFQSGNLFGKSLENKHDKYGIFMGLGPDFASDKEVVGLKMQDMTPNMLHLLDIPVPKDCDGKVNREIFSDNSSAKHRELSFGASSKIQPQPKISEKDAIKKALGKIKF
ncbi:MAG: hypothetical protein A2233_05170 [Candidatus Kerfeldbacteria bacterium RIFOXYA2_FULL_38_24]|uniref:Phosphodiesterase n=1 Tax=Candidatus Kerfeldbacteria bacterium RIFOXYB2_FULL_38_14 TaxID=1798547 RepID=A0A1G2BGF7_9BACT|nr:MAG: hypothetical protein A2233_05170 [Candidatus Kerfeldbacteria bacterium RIFOXYA2_FULL_38_24]OGY88222.1 MAG: hypothetical protein A2319_03465 [Candidatus Kerfeldbacteria bacterium RIFOXYB2_FULL_38_14]OGY89769.1 MAG: hypothetical protein A2458_05465 [Candidatus Kerfeldbacteria bacterium RIFOXYC2_FULL_38_9]